MGGNGPSLLNTTLSILMKKGAGGCSLCDSSACCALSRAESASGQFPGRWGNWAEHGRTQSRTAKTSKLCRRSLGMAHPLFDSVADGAGGTHETASGPLFRDDSTGCND